MPDESRRERLCIQAFDPETRGSCVVQFSQQRLLTIAKRGIWALKEAQVIVPIVLQHPTAVFEGLRRDEDEDSRGTGWRCYIGHPAMSFRKDGTEGDPYPNQVFLVFINDEGVAYSWRWEPIDFDNPDFPRGVVSPNKRFNKQVYYEGDD